MFSEWFTYVDENTKKEDNDASINIVEVDDYAVSNRSSFFIVVDNNKKKCDTRPSHMPLSCYFF